MTYQIDPALYDGQLHAIPCEVGEDFTAKWSALRADGFTCAIYPDHIRAVKLMAGDPIPSKVVWH